MAPLTLRPAVQALQPAHPFTTSTREARTAPASVLLVLVARAPALLMTPLTMEYTCCAPVERAFVMADPVHLGGPA